MYLLPRVTQQSKIGQKSTLRNGEQLLKSGGYTGGFVHQASLFDDVELIGINSPDRVFGGSSRSWNTKKVLSIL